eukprot:2968464-Pyramimonas_sp.AAC.1
MSRAAEALQKQLRSDVVLRLGPKALREQEAQAAARSQQALTKIAGDAAQVDAESPGKAMFQRSQQLGPSLAT